MAAKKRVAVIGGGPCGMSMMAAFRNAELNGQEIPEVVCFDKQADLGGLWNINWRTGLDEFGEHSHSSMYRYLWSNGPKECLEMGDYQFSEHWDKTIPSFPPRLVLRDYLLGRAKKYDVRRYLRPNTVVRGVKELDDKRFEVTFEYTKEKKSAKEQFDYVVVATGHFSVPHFPGYPGIDTFDGRVLHAHDFYNAAEFKGQKVFLIGSSYSAEDIGLQLYKYGAESVTISYRDHAMGFKWPEKMREVPGIKCFGKDRVHLLDGSEIECDAVLFCTGYQHYFPFMPDHLRLRSPNILYPNHLYKGCVWNTNTNLFYLGMQDQWWTFTLFDAQAWFARDVMLGKIDVSNAEARESYINTWYNRCLTLKTKEECLDFQRDMVVELFAETDYPKHDNEKIKQIFMSWLNDKKTDILTYRDKQYPSIFSEQMAPLLKMPWLQAFDDSLDGFVNNYQ